MMSKSEIDITRTSLTLESWKGGRSRFDSKTNSTALCRR